MATAWPIQHQQQQKTKEFVGGIKTAFIVEKARSILISDAIIRQAAFEKSIGMKINAILGSALVRCGGYG